MSSRDKIYQKEVVKKALERHPTRVAVALSLGCCETSVNRLIDRVFPDLKHLAKWKKKTKKIWGY